MSYRSGPTVLEFYEDLDAHHKYAKEKEKENICFHDRDAQVKAHLLPAAAAPSVVLPPPSTISPLEVTKLTETRPNHIGEYETTHLVETCKHKGDAEKAAHYHEDLTSVGLGYDITVADRGDDDADKENRVLESPFPWRENEKKW